MLSVNQKLFVWCCWINSFKIAATLSSVGTYPSVYLLETLLMEILGAYQKRYLILISYSDKLELRNIIRYANRNKILLIGIVSKRDSILYKASDIKLLIPTTKEAGGIVLCSTTTPSLGDALAISAMNFKKFGKIDFKKLHPSGSLGAQLKTVEDIMLVGKKIPFVNEKTKMDKALNVLSDKKLGCLIVRNSQKKTIGIITDGQIRRYNEQNLNLHQKTTKDIMTKNPISVEKNILAAKALSIMNNKKITSLCVHDKSNKNKTVGIIHVHNILQSNIS